MGRMRYEMMEEDGNINDMYQDRYQDPAYRKRYAGSRPTLRDQQDSLRAKNIFVYTNGTYDQVKIVYSKKRCRTLEALFYDIIAAKSRFSKMRVDYLYKWPSGEMVSSLADIEENGQTVFVCSDKKKKLQTYLRYHDMDFGGSESGSSRNSREPYRSEKPSPTSTRSQRSPMRGMNSRPITITVISNTHRNSRQSVFVNPNRPFDDLLKDITDMIEMAQPPCTALYTTRYPHEKADSNSSFKRIVLHNRVDQFYAVGREGEVFSSTTRDTSPIRNGYGKTQKSKNGYRQNGYQNTTNGYDKQNGYEDNGGRTYRRHQDSGERHRPDGNDYDDYSHTDRSGRDSPNRNVSQEQETARSRHGSNDRSRYESYEERSKDHSSRRQESDDRRRDDKRQSDRNVRGYDERRRDESHDRKGKATDRRRDDSADRGRDTRRRDDSRDRDDDRNNYRNGRKSPDEDDDRNMSRGSSPTESVKNARFMEKYGDGKKDLDKSVEY